MPLAETVEVSQDVELHEPEELFLGYGLKVVAHLVLTLGNTAEVSWDAECFDCRSCIWWGQS